MNRTSYKQFFFFLHFLTLTERTVCFIYFFFENIIFDKNIFILVLENDNIMIRKILLLFFPNCSRIKVKNTDTHEIK